MNESCLEPDIASITTTGPQALDFDCIPWRIEERDGADLAFAPVPGTWTLIPPEIQLKSQKWRNFKGLLSCPKCGNVTLLPWSFGVPGDPNDKTVKFDIRDARIVSELRCYNSAREDHCLFVCKATLLRWDTRRLYCVQYEIFVAGTDKVLPRDIYMHAESREDAIAQFWNSHSPSTVRMVDAAVPIGYYVEDKDGKILSVSKTWQKKAIKSFGGI